ncbi:hypothetical protein [Flavobacterium sp. '19STA2R22 D10 B1']|uniref:hypothetical protein n=1 Tax=Flavobacterium aerium TaxID=3037261 RepID=UPI00278C5F64|nr:hypothetical protein [Flavobacterium sp. '19STA2R22 D10 B1']
MNLRFKKLYLGLFTALTFSLLSCRENLQSEPLVLQSKPLLFIGERLVNDTIKEAKTLHTNPTYKYKYRTGETHNYCYNYDVIGTDELGNTVTGNINTKGRYGSGLLNSDEGKEMEVRTEWTSRGKLKAIDSLGQYYQLMVPE